MEHRTEHPSYYGSDERPYGLNEYECSPLNRVLKTYGPGKDWAAHPSGITYLSNVAFGELTCKYYRVSPSGTLITNGYYPAGQLYVIKSTDEDARVSYLFTDKLGQLLLSRRLSDGISHDTYYVYDDFGNKRFVLPPAYQDDPDLDLYAYQYKYDERNREIETKLPGCEPIYKAYDKADKLIYIQDGVQRTDGKWNFYLYDDFNRIIAGGVCKTESADRISEFVVTAKVYSRSSTIPVPPDITVGGDAATVSLGTATRPEVIIPPGGGVITLWLGEASCETNALFASSEILYINYYDNYSFLKQQEFASRNYFPEATVNATGYNTGSLVRIVGSDKVLANAIYYDTKGRPVREVSQNVMSGYDVRTTEYTFTGKPATVHHRQTEHKEREGIVAVHEHNFDETYLYTYDHVERVTKVVHQMDDNTPVILAENRYDEPGRLIEKRLHGNEQLKINYTYNLRGRLESISSPLFNQRLYYTQGGGTPQYGGNISSMTWQADGDKGMHKYDFTYDDLNRLTQAFYTNPTSALEEGSPYTVSYRYNKMGGITHLARYGLSVQPALFSEIDRLDLWYAGNRLRKVTDHASAADPLYNSAFNYVDGINEEQEFLYDGNGNMTRDLDKGMTIEYNTLGLASKVNTGGMDVLYKYSADGTKLQTSYSYSATIVEPADPAPLDSAHIKPDIYLPGDSLIYRPGIIFPASSAPLVSRAATPESVSPEKRYYYLQNAIRSNFGQLDDNLRTVFTEEGYITFINKQPVYHYFLQDHQGNNRVVVNQDGTVEQVTHYYPYGGWFGESTYPTYQKFKYGGKELDLTAGLNTYDFSARTQRPDFGSFPTMDPLCEKYYDCSPYAYCGNNPINRVDPTGMDWYRSSEGNYMWREGHEAIDGYENIGASVSIQLGENSYLNCYQNGGIWANQAVNAFDLIRSSLKLQNQFLERTSVLSAQSQTELLNAMNSRSIDEFARPIGESLVWAGAAELGGAFAGKVIGYVLKTATKGGQNLFLKVRNIQIKFFAKWIKQMIYFIVSQRV